MMVQSVHLRGVCVIACMLCLLLARLRALAVRAYILAALIRFRRRRYTMQEGRARTGFAMLACDGDEASRNRMGLSFDGGV